MTPNQKWVAYQTLVRREMLRLFRLWAQTLLPSAITTILYFVIFGNIIGSRIGEMGGYSYIKFISPGLIMLSMITGAYSGTVASFYGMKFGRNIEEMLVSPMPNYLILLGFVTGGVLRGFIIGVIVTIIALFFTHLHVHSFWIVFIVGILASLIFSFAGMINAVYAKSFDDISIIPTFVLTPLIYLGGVFYSIKLLPGIWQTVSLFNPIVYIIHAFRFGFLGVNPEFVMTAFLVMLLFAVGLYWFCLYLLRRGTGLRG